MPIEQLSGYRKGGSVLERNEQLMVADITNLIKSVNSGGGEQVVGTSIWANGFKLIGCIAQNIVLPTNSTLQYTSPLTMCVGYTLTIPSGTNLTII